MNERATSLTFSDVYFGHTQFKGACNGSTAARVIEVHVRG